MGLKTRRRVVRAARSQSLVERRRHTSVLGFFPRMTDSCRVLAKTLGVTSGNSLSLSGLSSLWSLET